jgi:hypothetical protein
VHSRPILAGAALFLTALSCRPSREPAASGLSVATQPPPSSLLRLPSRGGPADVYRVPSLQPSEWKIQGRLPELHRVIGADLDQRVVYSLDTKGNVVLLDLQSGRFRPFLARVHDGTMGPDGTLFTVDDSNFVTQTVRRTPVRLHPRLSSRPLALFGTKDDLLLTILGGKTNSLAVIGSDSHDSATALPAGPVTATFWGDLLAVAADSAVVLFDPRGATPPRSDRVSGHARLVAFSPSGHRLFVADADGRIQVMNRYSGEMIETIDLPGPAAELRPDPFGRWLLIRPAKGDSVWLVDMARHRMAGAVAADWAADLPTVTNQGLLLVKQGADVVAYDATREGWPRVGAVSGGSADIWLPLAWIPGPETATVTVVPDSTQPADSGVAGEPGNVVYLQVSSSQNPAWARDLAGQLRDAGLPASVLEPHGPDEGYRVVLGPYASREEAESAGRKLGRPFFIYQPGPRAGQ